MCAFDKNEMQGKTLYMYIEYIVYLASAQRWETCGSEVFSETLGFKFFILEATVDNLSMVKYVWNKCCITVNILMNKTDFF